MKESATPEIQEEANALIIIGNENSESQREANSPSGNEIPNRRVDGEANEHRDGGLAYVITQMIQNWKPPSPRLCRIYRVPHAIRRGNEEAYTPHVISIGPFHHDDERLKPMEELKLKYCKLLVEKSALDVENSLSTIRRMESEIRLCYEEPSSMLESDDYVKMILMDASFIIVSFLMSEGTGEWASHVSGDYLIAPQRSISILGGDIWLLENQLPFFVIEKLYDLAFSPSFSNYLPFKELTFKYYQYLNFQEMPYNPNLPIMHFLDLLRTFFLPTSLPKRVSAVELLYSASQLHNAGVKLKAVSKKCLFDLKFTNGVLEIPSFELFRNRVSFFRNLMALEQCCHLNNAYVTDYIRVLDSLIDTTQDVDLLVQKGILLNRSGDNNEVITWINNLCAHHVFGDNMNYDYCNLCKALNTFYERRLHKWKAILIRDYFGNPWRTTATIAAIILLVLTAIQTVKSLK